MSAYVVGIGSSAGGLEALSDLLPQLKSNGNISYVIAQHMVLDGHSDLMVKILNRYAKLDVVLASDKQALQPDIIYLIPAGHDGIVANGCIHLQPPAKERISTPSVNVLFKSIAESCESYGIGVILSGTGSDGVLGCRAIKQHHGMTIAQNPASASFNGMPSAAIEAGVIDQVIAAPGIAGAIAQKLPGSSHLIQNDLVDTEDAAADDALGLKQILELIREKTGVNFAGYRTETLNRRLSTRMATFKISTLKDYYLYLQKTPHEAQQLQQLFLVSFSSFFRDAAAFQSLENHLTQIVAGKDTGAPIDIWVAGCASGEEVYTLAILLTEIKTSLGRENPVRIRGSDLNPAALQQAISGEYTTKAMKEIAPAHLDKYFIQKDEVFVVNDSIKSMCSFALENVFETEVVKTLDLVSCRNLLIYFKGPLQDQLIGIFYQHLLKNGLLFLGQSESLNASRNHLFKALDLSHKLYVRR